MVHTHILGERNASRVGRPQPHRHSLASKSERTLSSSNLSRRTLDAGCSFAAACSFAALSAFGCCRCRLLCPPPLPRSPPRFRESCTTQIPHCGELLARLQVVNKVGHFAVRDCRSHLSVKVDLVLGLRPPLSPFLLRRQQLPGVAIRDHRCNRPSNLRDCLDSSRMMLRPRLQLT